MKNLIEAFPAQLNDAIEIGAKSKLSTNSEGISDITLLGLGGSAFGGELVKNFIYDQCRVPLNISRDYSIPAYVDENSLVIVSSYSGNTEETLSAYRSAREKGARIVCVTSGGELLKEAQTHGLDHIILPGGYPPRAAAGFSIVQQLTILNKLGFINDFRKDIEESISLLKAFDDHELAKACAKDAHGCLPVIYTAPDLESAAIRWRQQIEENAEQLTFYHIIPEMNHNELVGWHLPADILSQTAVFFLESGDIHPRIQIRMDISRGIIKEKAASTRTIPAKGESKLAKLFYLLHLGDWVSFYLAELNEVDPMPVKAIDFLKSELSKHS